MMNLMNFKENIVAGLVKETGLGKEEAEKLLEIPPDDKLGDYAFPCFTLSKKFKKNPIEIAQELTEKLTQTLSDKGVDKLEHKGAYLNFFINKNILAQQTIELIEELKTRYGSAKQENKAPIIVEYSSPNVAKHFGIHSLRSTAIGHAIDNILRFLGYKVIAINHLGDWGTQFGKLIYAYKEWGNKKELEEGGINYLNKLYVKFHEELEKDQRLEEKGKEWFKKLEEGNEEAKKLWKLFRDISMEEFQRIYDLLGIKFDSEHGEAFYEPQLDAVINLLRSKGITEESDGALVVPVGDKMPPCIIVKSDGATIYATRDIAAGLYRKEQFKPQKILYVVDHRQGLHFKQFFAVLEKVDPEFKDKLEHVQFGFMSFKDHAMSTRKGKVVLFEDVLMKAEELVGSIIKQKNPNLENQDKIIEQVALGAILFWDLSHDRNRDIIFDWKKVLDFEGETGPYVQYAHARACAVLRKAEKFKKLENKDIKLEKFIEGKLVKLLAKFNDVLADSAHNYKPSVLVKYLIELAQIFNEFYEKCPILKSDYESSRLRIVNSVKQVLENGLELLGIQAPESM